VCDCVCDCVCVCVCLCVEERGGKGEIEIHGDEELMRKKWEQKCGVPKNEYENNIKV
jgi:hypothetical protein